MLNTYPESWWCNCANRYWKSRPSKFFFLLLLQPVTLTPGSIRISQLVISSRMPRGVLCNKEVYRLLSTLDVTKANGPDEISARMLKHTATSITSSITNLFNLSLHTGHIPSEWKQSLVVPIPKSRALPTITDQFPFWVCSVSYWKGTCTKYLPHIFAHTTPCLIMGSSHNER